MAADAVHTLCKKPAEERSRGRLYGIVDPRVRLQGASACAPFREVIDGHLRLKAAEKLGLKEVPVILCDDWCQTLRRLRATRPSLELLSLVLGQHDWLGGSAHAGWNPSKQASFFYLMRTSDSGH